MCMIDFGCYTNHSLGMCVAADYNENHYNKGRRYTFICDRYSIASFPELDALSRSISNNLRCGLEIDIFYEDKVIPTKCIAVSNNGIKNLYRIVGRAKGKPLCIENLDDMLACSNVGIPNAIAYGNGRFPTEEQVSALRQFKTVILAFDNDEYGKEMSENVRITLASKGISAIALVYESRDICEAMRDLTQRRLIINQLKTIMNQ